MICNHCGAQIPQQNTACPECGAIVVNQRLLDYRNEVD